MGVGHKVRHYNERVWRDLFLRRNMMSLSMLTSTRNRWKKSTHIVIYTRVATRRLYSFTCQLVVGQSCMKRLATWLEQCVQPPNPRVAQQSMQTTSIKIGNLVWGIPSGRGCPTKVGNLQPELGEIQPELRLSRPSWAVQSRLGNPQSTCGIQPKKQLDAWDLSLACSECDTFYKFELAFFTRDCEVHHGAQSRGLG